MEEGKQVEEAPEVRVWCNKSHTTLLEDLRNANWTPVVVSGFTDTPCVEVDGVSFTGLKSIYDNLIRFCSGCFNSDSHS